MIKKSNNERKVWYKRWWAILVFIIIGLIIFKHFFLNPERDVRIDLERKGYEVIETYDTYTYCANKNLEVTSSSVSMKSLGNREDQVISGLIRLSEYCPSSETFFITIVEPTKECLYSFNGEVVKVWYNGLVEQGSNLNLSESIPEESQRIINKSLDFMFWEAQARADYGDCLYLRECLQNGIPPKDCPIENKECSFLGYAYEDYLNNGMTRNTIHSVIHDSEINGHSSCE